MVLGVNARTLQKKMPETREAMTRVHTKANPRMTEVFRFLRTPAVVLQEVRFESISIRRTLSPLLGEDKIAISEPRSPNISNLSLSIQDKLPMTHSKLSLPSSWKTKASVHPMKNTREAAHRIDLRSSSLQHLEWKGLDPWLTLAHLTKGDLFESHEDQGPQIQHLALTRDSP